MGRVQLVTWREARRLDDSQAAWAQGTLVGVQATADGRLALVDPGPPTFTRNSVAYKSDGTQVASGQPRFETVSGRTGVLVEEGTTNLLAANQSSVETDTTGFVADPGSTLTRDTTEAWHGAASLKCVQDGAAAGRGWFTDGVPCQPNTVYSGSLWLKGSGTVNVSLRAYTSDYAAVTADKTVTVTLTQSWQRVKIENLNSGANAARIRIVVRTTTAQAITFWADGLQIEQKSYATSWTLGTRAAETLTVPTAGVLEPQEGTFESWIYIPSASLGRAAVVLDVRDSTVLNRLYFEVATDKKPNAAINKNAATYIAKGPNPLSPGWHFVAMSWSSTRLACYADGALVAQYTSPPLLDNIATAVLGSIIASAYHFNSLIGAVRISRRARTDQEIAAAYAAGTLGVDEDTTYYLPGDSLAYGRGGYRIAPAIDLSRVGTAWASRIDWEADGATVDVLTSLDGQTWTEAQNGGPVPGISRGMDVTGRSLLVKQRLIAQDMAAAPVMRRLDARVIDQPRPGGRPGSVRLLTTGAGKVRLLV